MRNVTIPELNAAGLRSFALKMGAVIAVLFGLILPWLFGFAFPLWPWICAGVLGLWGLIAPSSLNPFYRGWMRVGLVIGEFNSKVILGLVFFVIIAPVGLVMRLFGKDPMFRKRSAETSSYRVRRTPSPPNHLERPY